MFKKKDLLGVEQVVRFILLLCAVFTVCITTGILSVLLIEGGSFFREVSLLRFLTDKEWTPLFADKHFGIGSLVCGTLVTSLVAMLIAVPMGLITAVYLSEYANPKFRGVVKPILECLAGVPTVVYGYFALLIVTPLFQRFIPELSSFNALSAGIVMGFMILPVVASLSEDAIYAIPQSLRDGGYALGFRRLSVIRRIVLPSALSGVVAAILLGAARAVGETMIVAIAAGQQPAFTMNPLVPVETLTAYIVQVSMGDTPYGTLEYRTIFAVGLTLFLLTLCLNAFSLHLKERYRRIYS